MTTVSVAVPRKGRPLEAVLERLATEAATERAREVTAGVDPSATAALADDIVSTLRYEKAIAKGQKTPTGDVYDRLDTYSGLDAPTDPEYTLVRDDRNEFPRRIVFDSVTVPLTEGIDVRLVGREEPFRALRKHEFALGFDSADLVLEEVVELTDEPLGDLDAVNERIDPRDTDVRLVSGLGDTVWHTLLGTPGTVGAVEADLSRAFVDAYTGSICISPRYERLVEAVLGTAAVEGLEFCYPEQEQTEEAAIADAGLGVYLTVTGSTARDHGLLVGERLFPSETVLLENGSELDGPAERVRDVLASPATETELAFH